MPSRFLTATEHEGKLYVLGGANHKGCLNDMYDISLSSCMRRALRFAPDGSDNAVQLGSELRSWWFAVQCLLNAWSLQSAHSLQLMSVVGAVVDAGNFPKRTPNPIAWAWLNAVQWASVQVMHPRHRAVWSVSW